MKKNKIAVFDGHGTPRRQGQGRGHEGRQDGRRADGEEHHPGNRRASARRCRTSSPTASSSGPTRRPWCPRRSRNRLLVIGSGAIGIEFASFYRDMGAEVTVVEVVDRILPVEDEEISAVRPQGLREAGHPDPHRRQGRRREDRPRAVPMSKSPTPRARVRRSTVDRVILAVGITGNVEDIGLDGTG